MRRAQRRVVLLSLLVPPVVLLLANHISFAKRQNGKLIPLIPIEDHRGVLRATIQHSEKLAPAPAVLRTGAIFDQSKLSTLTKDNSWYQIPEWFAGTWRGEEQKRYYEYDYRTGEEDSSKKTLSVISEEHIGWQTDQIGGIWEYQHGPYVTRGIGKAVYFISYVTTCIPLYVGQEKVVLRFSSVQSNVSRYSGRVLSTHQMESIQTYTPVTRFGFLQCVASMKKFNEEGKATVLTQAVTGTSRILPYKPINSYQGKDVRILFKQYLAKRGLKDRIP